LLYNHDSKIIWKLKIGSSNRNGYRRETNFFVWNLCWIEIKKSEKNNRWKDWRRDNREATIATQQSITLNRWRVLGAIFNSLVAYQVLQFVENEVVIIVAQTYVEEINISTSDGIQQSTQTSSLNVDHEY
jgi:hypothetical protein